MTDKSPWGLTREYPNVYADWQYEVAGGDTLQSFIEYLEAWLEDQGEPDQWQAERDIGQR